MYGVYSIYLSQLFPSKYTLIRTYLVDLLVCEFGCTVILSFQLPICVDLVLDVISLCPDFQMVGVTAAWVMTHVSSEFKLFKFPTQFPFEGELVNSLLFAVQPEKTITICVSKPIPFPTIGRIVLGNMTEYPSPRV